MADTAQPVLKAVVAALRANAAVTGFVAQRVYSDVPENEAFPYILVELKSAPFAANDFSGQIHTVRIHAYSRMNSKKEALQVRAAAHAVLDRQEHLLTLDSGQLVKSEYSGVGDCIPEDNGKTWGAMGEFELWVM